MKIYQIKYLLKSEIITKSTVAIFVRGSILVQIVI